MSRNGNGSAAVFLDRDGVLTCPIWNAATHDYEAPKTAEDVALIDGVVEALRRLCELGYRLVVISNQPDVAKGKMTCDALAAVEMKFVELLAGQGVVLDGVYYCYHHPRGTVPELTVTCQCRKPLPGLVERASRELNLDPAKSWFVGDRDTDVICGRSAGCRTILVRSEESKKPGWGESNPDFVVNNLGEAVKLMGQSS